MEWTICKGFYAGPLVEKYTFRPIEEYSLTRYNKEGIMNNLITGGKYNGHIQPLPK